MWAHKKKHILYIVYEMKFKDKTYGCYILIANLVVTSKKNPSFIVFIFNFVNYTMK
jgi:hypothetical protein